MKLGLTKDESEPCLFKAIHDENIVAIIPHNLGVLIENTRTNTTRYVSFREVQSEQKATA